MAVDKKCGNDTEQGCPGINSLSDIATVPDEWLEEEFMYGFRRWHIMFLSMAGTLGFVILLCCCLKFRIPRTKQEIEGDFVRRKILRKFRQRLKAIQNQELDEMDLKRALDKIRAEFKSDTESLAQSEAGFSVNTISSTGLPGAGHHGQSSTYRRASQMQIDISLEDLRMSFAARMTLAVRKFFGRSKVSQSEVPLGENGVLPAENGNKVVEDGPLGENKATKMNSKKKIPGPKVDDVSVTIPEGAVASESKEKSEKKNKVKLKDAKGKDDQCVAPAENVEAKIVSEKSNKRNNKKKDDPEKGKSEKVEKDNKREKEKEKDKAEKVKAEKEKKDKVEKEREKKEKLDKEKKERKEKADLEKKEKAEREKTEKATKTKEKEQKGQPGASKENNIKGKK